MHPNLINQYLDYYLENLNIVIKKEISNKILYFLNQKFVNFNIRIYIDNFETEAIKN